MSIQIVLHGYSRRRPTFVTTPTPNNDDNNSSTRFSPPLHDPQNPIIPPTQTPCPRQDTAPFPHASARRVLLRRRLPRGARVLWVSVLRLLTVLHLLVIRAVTITLLLLLWLLLLLPAQAGMLREALHGYRAAHAALHVWSVSRWWC